MQSALKALNLDTLVPIMDVPTRWVSMFYMLERFLYLYPAYALCATRGDFDDLRAEEFVTPTEVRILQALLGALSPVEEFVRLVEGEKYATLELVPVLLRICFDSLSPHQQLPSISTTEKRFRSTLYMNMTARLGYILERPNLALAAAALSPRFGHLGFVREPVADAMWAEMALWIADPEHGFPAPATFSSRVEDIDGADADMPPIPRRVATMDEVKQQLQTVRGLFEASAPKNGVTEVRKSDTLAWWRRTQRAGTVPAICHLVRIVYCVPATSAASEREFSNSGSFASARRAALDSDKIEMMSLVRSVIRLLGVDAWNQWIEERLQALRSASAKPPRANASDGDED